MKHLSSSPSRDSRSTHAQIWCIGLPRFLLYIFSPWQILHLRAIEGYEEGVFIEKAYAGSRSSLDVDHRTLSSDEQTYINNLSKATLEAKPKKDELDQLKSERTNLEIFLGEICRRCEEIEHDLSPYHEEIGRLTIIYNELCNRRQVLTANSKKLDDAFIIYRSNPEARAIYRQQRLDYRKQSLQERLDQMKAF